MSSPLALTPAHTLAVHHVLAATAPHPSTTAPRAVIPPFGTPTAPKQTVRGRISPAIPPPAAKAMARPTPKEVKADARAPGLKLLSRLGKGGKAGEKERQKQ